MKVNWIGQCDRVWRSTTAYRPSCLCPSARLVRVSPIGYRRFNTAAEAIRFAVEECPAIRTFGPWMQVGDERFDTEEIVHLYESRGFPLVRNKPD
jgi:hypothetical protein